MGKIMKIVELGRLVTGPRDFEIHKFNNTILSGADLQIFTYYWKIEHLSAKLKENISLLTSPIFSISGLDLRIKANLNHLNREFLFLQLEQVEAGAKSYSDDNGKGDTSNLILKTGNLFKKVQTKVLFKHTITILNQVRSKIKYSLAIFVVAALNYFGHFFISRLFQPMT